MDIQSTFGPAKLRKGSCSTLDSQDSDQNCSESHLLPLPKQKRLRKNDKTRRTSKSGPYNLKSNIAQNLHTKNRSLIFLMLKQLKDGFGLHIDTYLICLKVIQILKFDGDSNLCAQVAAIICYMVQKMYQSNKISFKDLEIWTNGALTKEVYIDSEAVILMGLGFQLPTIDCNWRISEIQNEIAKMEKIFSI